MKEFKVTRRDGQTATISAASCQRDGSGTRFYDEAGLILHAFEDGVISEVTDANISWAIAQPATQDEPPVEGTE